MRPWRVQLTDADLLELRGVRFLDMSGSLNVTDTGFAHLAGIHTLKMRYCQAAITDAAFAHLAIVYMAYHHPPL